MRHMICFCIYYLLLFLFLFMTQLPKIESSRRDIDPSNNSQSNKLSRKYDLYSSQSSVNITTLTYSQRLHQITKSINYQGLIDNAIWREYEQLRETLKMLNNQILFEMEKRAFTIKRNNVPKPKSIQDSLRLLQQDRKNNETIIESYKQQIQSLQNRCKKLSQQNVKQQFETEIQTLKNTIPKIKAEIKQMSRKSKLLSKDISNGPQLLEILEKADEQLVLAERKLKVQKNRSKQIQNMLADLSQKTKQINIAIESRIDGYKQVSQSIQQQQRNQKYQDLRTSRDNIKKYESPLKKNYLLKLKDLDNVIAQISHHDKIIHQTEHNIMMMRSQIDSISSIVNQRKSINMIRKQTKLNKTKDDQKRHSSMEIIKSQNDKIITEKQQKTHK